MNKQTIYAFLIFNIFSILLIFAFEDNAAYIFDQEDIRYQVFALGGEFYTGGLSWGDHYLYRLFASITVTFIAASIVTSIVEKNAGIVAAISNTPSIIFWLYSLNTHLMGADISYGYVSISVIAPILTTWIAYKIGKNESKEGVKLSAVMSINSYHWIWISLVAQPFSIGLIYSLYLSLDAFFSLISFAYSGSRGNVLSPSSILPNFLHGLSYLSYVFNLILSSLPILAFAYLIKNAYLVLSGLKLADKSVVKRTIFVIIFVIIFAAIDMTVLFLRDVPYMS